MPGLNKVIKTLIFSDFLLQSGWGLIGPIFAIFITQQIENGSLIAVGFIAAAYWFTKSAAQPFIAHFLDVKKGEGDDFRLLIIGLFLANLVPLGYAFASCLWHIFLLEIIRGICMACVIPSWYGIFTRHIDKGWEAFSWSIESTGVGLAAAFAAAFGGIMANFLGFKVVFVLISFFGLMSCFLLLSVRNQLFTKKDFEPKIPPVEMPKKQF
ncbi:MAG: MFS transporter [bacterium]|nr:MFS transporter [bacterium]